MIKKVYNPQPLKLKLGYSSDKYYSSYKMMSKSMHNWQQLCPYQLCPNGLSGKHKVLQLDSMQIAYAERNGGTMHNAGSPKDSITIAVVEKCKDKACFGHLKLKEGDILFFDDSQYYSFITNDTIKFTALTIQKSSIKAKYSKLFEALNLSIKDIDMRFTTTLHEAWKHFAKLSHKKIDILIYKKTEEEILEVIMKLLLEQTPCKSKLSNGEKVALTIRDKVFYHMDGTIRISELAKEYKVSEQTLQNSFKSLFGFTPKLFVRLLKLNLAHQELQKSYPSQNTVSKIAAKWGFKHMGRFSAYYKELFGKNPSQTLKNIQVSTKGLSEECVLRQEDIMFQTIS